MDFFEKLRKRAMRKVEELRIPASLDSLQAVQATIEALKEKLVGELIPMTVVHGGERYPNTFVIAEGAGKAGAIRLGKGHHGTDGEEVVVMVFRGVEEISDRQHIIHTGEEVCEKKE